MRSLLKLTQALLFSLPAFAAWPNGYTYRYALTVQSSQITGTLSNFASYVCFDSSINANCLSNSDKPLALQSNGGRLANGSSGYDFIITSDSAGSTPLNYLRISQNTTTGAALLRLLDSSIADGTVVYLFCGNAAVTTDQSAGSSTYPASFGAMYHLEESSNPYNDSTSNALNSNGGTYPTQSTGFLGKGQTFARASSQFINAPTTPITGTTTTQSVWFKTTDSGTNAFYDGRVVGDSATGCVSYLAATLANGFCNAAPATAGVTALNDGNWHNMVLVLNGTTTIKIRVDGAAVSSTSSAGFLRFPTFGNAIIGGAFDPVYYEGILDELAIFNTALSDDEISAYYKNASNNAAFWSLSAAQTSGSSTPRGVISF